MRRIQYYIPIFLFTIILFSGCSSVKEAGTSKPDKGKSELSTAVRTKVERTFFDGQRAKILGDYEEALKLFEQVLRLDADNSAAKYELAMLYSGANLQELAIQNAADAVEIDPANKWYLMLYADLLALNSDYKTASDVYRQLVESHPDNIDYYYDWAYMLIKAGKYDDALQAYDQLEEKVGIDESIVVQRQKIYLKLNKMDKAEEEIRKLIEAFPNEVTYYGLLAELFEANDLKEKAMNTYQEILVIEPDNPQAILALADLSNQQGDKEGYMQYMRQAFRSDKLDVDTKIRVLYPYIEFFEARQEEIHEAYELAGILVEVHESEAKAHAIQGDLFYLSDMEKEALQSYEKALEYNKEVFTVWQQVMVIISDRREYERLLERANEAIGLFPNQPLPYLFKGLAYQQTKRFEEAVKPFEKGVKLTRNNPALQAQFYSNLGDVYNGMKNHHASDSCYEESIRIDPSNPYVMNNYSYYLSLRSENLERAAELSKLSNELLPNTPSFQDTYAWILYKKGDYKEAREWQEKAIENSKDTSAVLLEHYGDILFQLGEVEEAVRYWQDSLDKGSDSELLGKKIADKMLYEEE